MTHKIYKLVCNSNKGKGNLSSICNLICFKSVAPLLAHLLRKGSIWTLDTVEALYKAFVKCIIEQVYHFFLLSPFS